MGGPKHLLRVGGEPLLGRVVRALRGSQVSEITVVLRADDIAGRELALQLGARVASPEDPDEGRAASVRAGVQASRSDAAALVFAMADQPFLNSGDFDALLEVFWQGRSGIVHASYAGARGTPVVLAIRYRAELLKLRGGEGGRVLIDRHPADVRGVELDPARGRDLDRPEDLPADRNG
jgi:molybdenum cofactor cytidylyltransferase